MDNSEILKFFQPLFGQRGGIDSWLGQSTPDEVFNRLSRIKNEPLSKAQLDQLLIISHEAGISDDFFNYYWLSTPIHPYDVKKVPDYNDSWIGKNSISSLSHLKWGFYRLYIDTLLFFGNVRSGYRFLRMKSKAELDDFFQSKIYDSIGRRIRGPPLKLVDIKKDDRYLISEMCCKSYDVGDGDTNEIKKILKESLIEHKRNGGGKITIHGLLEGYVKNNHVDKHQQLLISADEILDEEISTEKDINEKCGRVAETFYKSREAALQNTRYYLSMVNDLDIYIATSMRNRKDFRDMANTCETIFKNEQLKMLELRYFDPTMSAAQGHEDKGLIECLMVKAAKVLIYSAGEKESYGKDAEAAMALSLGKPVIFFCDREQRSHFYKNVHPLSRLIHFDSGVAVGVMVTDSLEDVIELVKRIFNNDMEYEIEQSKPGYLKLKERLTKSVVRLQTNDDLLRETFWNYYHNQPTSGRLI